METLKFKTNIKCGGCIASVTPSLNSLAGIEKWEVDTTNPEKILTVQAQSEVTSDQIVSTLKEKGYIAEKIS
jgi:copper chaperone